MAQHKYIVDENLNYDDLTLETVALRFGSHEPSADERALLDYCESLSVALWDAGFMIGDAQNSEYGTGVYYTHRINGLLVFIGVSAALREAHSDFAFSVALNTPAPLTAEQLALFNCLQLEDESDGENWIYVPIKCERPTAENPEPEELFEAINTAFKAIFHFIVFHFYNTAQN